MASSRSSGEDGNITRLEPNLPAFDAPEFQRSSAARHAHHFMNLRMVVHEVIDSVAPGPVPAIRLKQRVDHHGWVEPAARNLHRTAIDDHRKAGVVRNDAVIGEYQGQRLARAQHLAQPRRIGPILDKLFGVILNLVFERHGLSSGCRLPTARRAQKFQEDADGRLARVSRRPELLAESARIDELVERLHALREAPRSAQARGQSIAMPCLPTTAVV
jgi:hypothetical protein